MKAIVIAVVATTILVGGSFTAGVFVAKQDTFVASSGKMKYPWSRGTPDSERRGLAVTD